jgi:hypothetical protein
MNTEARRMLLAWVRQFGVTFLLYLAVAAAAAWALTTPITGPLRTGLILVPIIPGLWLIWLTLRSYARSDEFIRLRILQAASLTAVLVAALALVYAYLELLGLPRLSAVWLSNFIWLVFVLQMVRLFATGK